MSKTTRIRGTTADILITRNDKGKILKVSLGDIIFYSDFEVTLRQKETHQQLTLMANSIKNARTGQMVQILAEEAKKLRDQLTDPSQIKDIFPKRLKRKK